MQPGCSTWRYCGCMPRRAAAPWRGVLLGVCIVASWARQGSACTVFRFDVSGFAGELLQPLQLLIARHTLWTEPRSLCSCVCAANARHLLLTYGIFSENGTIFVDNRCAVQSAPALWALDSCSRPFALCPGPGLLFLTACVAPCRLFPYKCTELGGWHGLCPARRLHRIALQHCATRLGLMLPCGSHLC